MRNSLLLVVVFTFMLWPTSADTVKRIEEPLTFQHAINWKSDASLEFDRLDLAKIGSEDQQTVGEGRPIRVAVARTELHRGEFRQQGQWSTVDDMSIWRLKVNAQNAAWLSFAFEELFLPAGSSLFVYNEQRTDVLGPYTDKDNKKSRRFWTPMVTGDTAYVEINVPTHMRPYLSFSLTKVNQGYRTLKALNTPKVGACNIDVVCPQGNGWRDEIRSVARYIFDSGGGTFTCTGNLVNNLEGDRKAYFMTASHCVSTAAEVQSMVLFWNFEKSQCGGPADGSQAQSQSGARLLATVGSLGGPEPQRDMTLVELDEVPDEAFNVHWSGWEAGTALPTSGVSIHHPDGTEKRISVDSGPIVLTNFGSTQQRPDGSHLMIAAWDEGTTEGGSSGSGFWNQDRRIVGVLSGGGASCDTPDAPDFYAHLASHYDVGSTSSTRMKAWLDPNNTGQLRTDGVDACEAPQVSFSVNPNPAEAGEAVAFTSNVTGGSGPFDYAWDFDGDGTTDSTAVSPSFTYTSSYIGNVDLTVSGGDSCTAASSVGIVVTPAGGNSAPTAVATVSTSEADEGSTVSLSAASSSDPDNDTLSFAWVQSAGPIVSSLSNASASAPTVVLPLITSDTTVTFDVTVTDPFGASDTSSVSITVNNVNMAPNAIVSNPTISATEGSTVMMNAASSSDADGDALTFSWSQTSGASVTLNATNTSMVSFTAPSVTSSTSLVFTVTVTDSAGLMDTANVTVTVNPAVVAPPSDSGGGGGGALGLPTLFMLLLGAALRAARALRKAWLPVLGVCVLAGCSTPEAGQGEAPMIKDNVTAQSASGEPSVRLIRLDRSAGTSKRMADITQTDEVMQMIEALDARERRYEKIKPLYDYHLEVTQDGETEVWQVSPKGYIQKEQSYELYKIDVSTLQRYMK